MTILLQRDTPSFRIVAQLATPALRIRAEEFRAEVGRSTVFHHALLRYAHDMLSETSRAFVCHRFHSTAQRLSRLLLVVGERAGSDPLAPTPEPVAPVMGLPRAHVRTAPG